MATPKERNAILVTSNKVVRIPAGSVLERLVGMGYDFIGYNDNPRHRAELQGAPKFRGLAGPAYDGPDNPWRYETTKAYAELSR